MYGGLLAGKPLMILLSVALSLYSGADLQEVIFIKKKIFLPKKKKNPQQTKPKAKTQLLFSAVVDCADVFLLAFWTVEHDSLVQLCECVVLEKQVPKALSSKSDG